MENFDHILLFKTNCCSPADKTKLQSILDKGQGIEKWNLDMEDCDHVLRIVSYETDHAHIIQLLHIHGYECCELA